MGTLIEPTILFSLARIALTREMSSHRFHLWLSSLLFFSNVSITGAHPIDLYAEHMIRAGPTYGSYQFNVLQHLSAISPYFESNANTLSPDPPHGCDVSKAAYLVRHGSIYANAYDYSHTIQPFLKHLENLRKSVNFSQVESLAFLSRWTSPITDSKEQVGKLTKAGGLEAFHLGTQLAVRYSHLISTNTTATLKVWCSDSNRTRESATLLSLAMHGGQDTVGPIISISESAKRGANILTPKEACPRFKASWGSKQASAWLTTYSAPIIARLSTDELHFNFSANDVLAMQELCGYETVIRGSSPFCDLFTPDEWLALEYYFDIKYYYELSYGNDLSPSLGMPWVVASSELLNRTTATDQNLYISIAHREMPPFILTSLGLYNDSSFGGAANTNATFPLDEINHHRLWKSGEFVPFLGRVALERLDCTSAAKNGSFVRVLVNSAPKPLPGCASGPGSSCPLKQYMAYIDARNGMFDDFSKACHIPQRNTSDMLTIYS